MYKGSISIQINNVQNPVNNKPTNGFII